jgi:hypothetical protein
MNGVGHIDGHIDRPDGLCRQAEVIHGFESLCGSATLMSRSKFLAW